MILELTEIYITPQDSLDTSPATLDFDYLERTEPPPSFKGEKPAKRKTGRLTRQEKQSITDQTLEDAELYTRDLDKRRKMWTEHSKKGTAGLLDAVDPCAPVFCLFLTALASFPRCVATFDDGRKKIYCIGTEALRPDPDAPKEDCDGIRKVIEYLLERDGRGRRPFCDAVDDIKTVLSRCITNTARDRDSVRAVVEAVAQVDIFVETFLEEVDPQKVCDQLIKMRHAFLEVKKAVAVYHRKTLPLPNTVPTFKRTALLPEIIAESDGSVRSKHRRKMTQKESDKAFVMNMIIDEHRKLKKKLINLSDVWKALRDMTFTHGTCTATARELFEKNIERLETYSRRKSGTYHLDTQRPSAVRTFSTRSTT